MAVKQLEKAVRHGWHEVNTEKLVEEVHTKMEETSFDHQLHDVGNWKK